MAGVTLCGMLPGCLPGEEGCLGTCCTGCVQAVSGGPYAQPIRRPHCRQLPSRQPPDEASMDRGCRRRSRWSRWCGAAEAGANHTYPCSQCHYNESLTVSCQRCPPREGPQATGRRGAGFLGHAASPVACRLDDVASLHVLIACEGVGENMDLCELVHVADRLCPHKCPRLYRARLPRSSRPLEGPGPHRPRSAWASSARFCQLVLCLYDATLRQRT